MVTAGNAVLHAVPTAPDVKYQNSATSDAGRKRNVPKTKIQTDKETAQFRILASGKDTDPNEAHNAD